jgi:molecular chaperone DnaK (HSP70)
LDKDASASSYDDPKLQDLYKSGLVRLPPNMSARDVCRDYLTGLYAYTVERIKKHIGSDVFEASPVECWITVPGIWLPKAQVATLEAARKAGFGSRPRDSIQIIPEPEAAALTALIPHTRPGALNAIQVSLCNCMDH